MICKWYIMNCKGDYLKVIPICFFMFIVSTVIAQSITEYSLFSLIAEDNKVIRLRILPNGQIIDPLQQYTTLMDTNRITYDTNRKYLYVSCRGYGSPGGINSFIIQNDGSLLPLETTTTNGGAYNQGAIRTTITPNNQLLIPITSTLSVVTNTVIYEVSSTGQLTDTGNRFNRYGFPCVDPFGRVIISNDTATIVISGNTTQAWVYDVYSINYLTKTVTQTQVVPNSGSNIFDIRFPKSGTMGIVYGVDCDTSSHDLSVIWIDSFGNVTAPNLGFHVFANVYDVALLPNDQYAYICGDTTINLFSVNTITRTITDTGYRFRPPNGKTPFLFRLNDSGTFGVLLYVATDGLYWLTSAFINPSNGELTWTGYTFAIDSIYAGPGTGALDIQWVPVYATSIPSELWGKLE